MRSISTFRSRAAKCRYPGDIIVGDDEGVVVIPQHLAEEVAEEAFEQTAFEDFVQEQVEQGRSIFGIYPPGPDAREEFKPRRAANRPLARLSSSRASRLRS